MGEFWVWYDQDEMVIRRYRIKVKAPSEEAARERVIAHNIEGPLLDRDELGSCVYERDIKTDEHHFMDLVEGEPCLS